MNYQNMKYDVIVCGGGCAGTAAALAAARGGAKTLLIERAGFAGGIVTCVGLPYFDGLIGSSSREGGEGEGDDLHIPLGEPQWRRVIAPGIALELYAKMGGCEPNARKILLQSPPHIDNIEKFKLLVDRLLVEESDRLDVLYHAFAADVRMRGDRIDCVLVATKAGLLEVAANTVIDCTGDADIAQRAGAPIEARPDRQPLTLHFRIGNVRPDSCLSALCRESLERAYKRGDLACYYGPGIMFMFAANEVYVHATRVPADAADPADLTRAEMQGRRDAWTMFECWQREIPHFADAYYIASGPYIGVRETRCIVGQYVLTENDLMQGKRFDDAIASGNWFLDQHPNLVVSGGVHERPSRTPPLYQIPYRSLLPRFVSNLLVAGRCHSATQMAASSTRVTATAMAMGEAAGVAAGLAAARRTSVQELKGTTVRGALDTLGAGPVADTEAV
jgi:hypothetical protein